MLGGLIRLTEEVCIPSGCPFGFPHFNTSPNPQERQTRLSQLSCSAAPTVSTAGPFNSSTSPQASIARKLRRRADLTFPRGGERNRSQGSSLRPVPLVLGWALLFGGVRFSKGTWLGCDFWEHETELVHRDPIIKRRPGTAAANQPCTSCILLSILTCPVGSY